MFECVVKIHHLILYIFNDVTKPILQYISFSICVFLFIIPHPPLFYCFSLDERMLEVFFFFNLSVASVCMRGKTCVQLESKRVEKKDGSMMLTYDSLGPSKVLHVFNHHQLSHLIDH